tara:strand:+ start:251 stop:433 length:183 start_codon:yes stop_codon:yes gene_type:complete
MKTTNNNTKLIELNEEEIHWLMWLMVNNQRFNAKMDFKDSRESILHKKLMKLKLSLQKQI